MTEHLRSGNYANSANTSAKMSNDLTPRKTMLILVIVVGCFAVLWPKVFYPMLVGSANQHIKPSPIDKTTGCCDVISETDVHTIKIMSELCKTIIKRDEDVPLTGREIIAKCQKAVLETCGIDISAILQEKVRLGQSVKQILDEVRSLNGSLCLKYNFGVAPWRLGVPHRVTIKMSPYNIKQERPLHLRSELVHPAFRERGRAIPQTQAATPSRPSTRVVEGRPGPIPGMRPTLGGAGHVVPPPKQGTGSMGLIMPIYTIGIVIFFTYTVMKIVFKKQPESLYPPVEPDLNFRKEVFESERNVGPKLTREGVSSKLVVNAMSALLDEVDQEIESRRKASEVAEQDVVSNGNMVTPQDEEQPSVKVLGMETTASCEGGKKWSRPESPVLPSSPPHPAEATEPLQEIFLEGALPAQSHLLVADSATETQKPTSEEDSAVVLAGKMTLSVISLDSSENGTDESSNFGRKQGERSSSNVSDEFEKIDADIHLGDQIDDVILEAQNITGAVEKTEEINLLEEIENDIKELASQNIIGTLEQLDKPVEIQSVEEQILNASMEDKSNNLPITEVAKEFVENEQQIEKDAIDESIINSLTKEKELLATELNTINNAEIEEIGEKPIETLDIREQDLNQLEEDTIVDQKTPKSAISKLTEKDEINIEASKQQVLIPEKEVTTVELPLQEKETSTKNQPDINTVKEIIDEQSPQKEQKQELIQNETENIIAQSLIESKVTEVERETLNVPKVGQDSATEQASNIVDEKIMRNEKCTEAEANLGAGDSPNTEETKHILERDAIHETEPSQNIAASEIETFEKLNAAISDLSSELRPSHIEAEKDITPDNKTPEDFEEDEEIEYEYEDSDNEVVDEEIRNVDRLDDLADQESAERLNGDDHEQSKYVTTSSATLAENEISDEEDLENEDDDEEEIEEIIEYVTDDEGEIEEIVQPGDRNNVNHINEN